ncbi:EAL domain-containing protein [Polynucleobacter sp. MWH-Braz-FAM2G]|uniref:bifunctional diguanylate cyclase/phosphodiesterase n=1 Tax=Polynucleobacter sp. MWH-Braz-FAM2G TaxID=1855883 RepID=UPI001BFCD8D7|nr:EAL domain-containing protein [Polynucleobacter sp. MWH-Braz-FAM2G]QWD89989.1 EAL domain-containing protein [Polynucleobacter sp. MWH-Braz-FAM2G]
MDLERKYTWPFKVGLIATLCLVLVWATAFLEIQHNNEQEHYQSEQRVISRSRIFGEYVASTIKRLDEILLDSRQFWTGDWSVFSKYIQSKHENISDIAFQIAVIDKDGRLLFSNLAPATDRTDLSQREHFKVHQDHPTEDQLFISKPLIGKVSKKWSIQFSRPIFKDGKFAGVIVASVDPKHFGLFAQTLKIDNGDVISIIRDTGERMARYPIDESSYGQKLTDLPFMGSNAPFSGVFQRQSAHDGISRLYGFYRLPANGLTILAGESTEVAGLPANEYRNLIIAYVVAISFLIAFAAFLIWRRGEEKQRSERALNIASMVYKNSSEAMLITDKHGIILTVNSAFTELTGYDLDEVVGKTPHILNSDIQDKDFWRNFWSELNSKGSWKGEVYNRRKNGEIYIEQLVVDTIFTKDSDECFRVALFHDVTRDKNNQELILQQANFDGLTGLPNRRLFLEKLNQEAIRSQRGDAKFALIFLDLDHFKDINDSLGHTAGDELLSIVGSRLSQAIRQVDTVARMGGDEFTLILSGLVQIFDVEVVARKVLEQLSSPYLLQAEEVYVSASLGIAIYPDDTQDIEELIRYADQAMYVSKETGRNRYTFFSASMQEDAARRMKLINEMHIALKEEQWEIHYQPIVELETGKVCKAEALVRWNHPTRGNMQPGEFIPLAEEVGLIEEIDAWMLKKVCMDLATLNDVVDEQFQISVNRSAREFRHSKDYIEKLAKFDVPLERIVLEITEGVLMDESLATVENIQKLYQAGVSFALDDFGTGYSSMSYLRRFPVAFLKIDQSFVSNLNDFSSKDSAFCESIISLAHKLRVKVIAEGVETLEQVNWLRRLGCDYVQGYYYFKPVSINEFYKILAKQNT